MPGARETPAEPLRGAQDATQPEWAPATVVQDSENDLWGRHGNEFTLLGDVAGAGSMLATDRLEENYGPLTVILDADGNPPTPEPEPRLHSVDADVAWAHYRKTYQPNPGHMAAAHKAFHAGWAMASDEALRDNPDLTYLAEDEHPEPEWLDADTLDDMPGLTVAITRGGTEPRWRDETGEWCLLGHNGLRGITSTELAPARVLWTPEANR